MTSTELSARGTHLTLGVSGMTCAACATRIEKVLKRLPGVTDANVNLATEVARVDGDGRITRDAVAAAIRKAGYDVRAEGRRPDAGAEVRRGVMSMPIGAVLTVPRVAPRVGAVFDTHVMLPAWWQLALALRVQFWLGAPFYTGAWKALRGGTANMDVLVALGTSAAFGLSLYLMAGGAIHLYFESAAVIIVLS